MSKIDLKQRRMFLKLGAYTLAIPFLPSLLSRAQAQAVAAAPVRFVSMISKYGTHRKAWVPNVLPNNEVRPGVYAMPLSSINGNISPSLGTQFNGIRDKLTFITGLDILNDGGHNQAAPLSSGGGYKHEFGSVVGYTIDEIMARSAKVYPNPVKTPAIRLSPYFGSNPSWSFWAGANVPYQTNAKSLADSIFGASGLSNTEFVSQKRRQLLAIDKVLPEFNRVRQGSAISSEDKRQLENFADHLQDLQKRISATQQVSGCASPNLGNGTSTEAIYSIQIDLIVAAMACNLTRVGVLYMGAHRNRAGATKGVHDVSHSRGPVAEKDNAYYNGWILDRVAEMMNKMNAIQEGNGKTLLDNSIVFYGNETAIGEDHMLQNMPVVIGGSAGGKIRTGNYISYESRPFRTLRNFKYYHPLGRPYNDLLMDFMRCMGLSAADWEMGKSGAGFGEYTFASHKDVAGYYNSFLVGNRSKSLPYFLVSS